MSQSLNLNPTKGIESVAVPPVFRQYPAEPNKGNWKITLIPSCVSIIKSEPNKGNWKYNYRLGYVLCLTHLNPTKGIESVTAIKYYLFNHILNPTKGIERLVRYSLVLQLKGIWTQQRELKDLNKFLMVRDIMLRTQQRELKGNWNKYDNSFSPAVEPNKGNWK